MAATIAKTRLRPLAAATAATINTIACVNIENATMPMKIISSFEFPDESDPASRNHTQDSPIRAASMQPLSQYRDFGPAHIFTRIARPVLQTQRRVTTSESRESRSRRLPCRHRSQPQPSPAAPAPVPCPSQHTGTTASVRGHSTPSRDPHPLSPPPFPPLQPPPPLPSPPHPEQ